MSLTKRYRVIRPNAIAQGGRWLPVGAVIELEPHMVTGGEFLGRLEEEDGTPVLPLGVDAREFAARVIRAVPADRRALVDERIAFLRARAAAGQEAHVLDELHALEGVTDEELARYHTTHDEGKGSVPKGV